MITQDTLTQYKQYDAGQIKNIVPFMRSSDKIDGRLIPLGNMCSGFPFTLIGTNISFYNSEAAYIAGMFSNDIEVHRNIQQMLLVNQNGFNAKKDIRETNDSFKRQDWNVFNIVWMLYVVWSKCKTNADFRNLLLSLPEDAVIIENSYVQNSPSAALWGCRNDILKAALDKKRLELSADCSLKKEAVYRKINELRLTEYRHCGVYCGCNVMGKILMICSRCLRNNIDCHVDYNLLREKEIYINGQLLDFSKINNI